jgi:hypothetical protein
MPTKKTDTPAADQPVQEQTSPTPESDQPVQEQTAPEPTFEQNLLDNVVEEVLGGRYGDPHTARTRLTEAGHDSSAVFAAVNERISRGAPSAYRPTAVDLLKQVQNGEWGDRRGLSRRLAAAGFGQAAINEVLTNLDKE